MYIINIYEARQAFRHFVGVTLDQYSEITTASTAVEFCIDRAPDLVAVAGEHIAGLRLVGESLPRMVENTVGNPEAPIQDLEVEVELGAIGTGTVILSLHAYGNDKDTGELEAQEAHQLADEMQATLEVGRQTQG